MSANSYNVYVCNGFNRNVEIPGEMNSHQSLSRIALVFSPDYNKAEGVEWNKISLFFWQIVERIKCRLHSVVNVEEDCHSISEKESEAPRRVMFCRDGQLCCIIQTEFWCYCGGSFPYSDSYTFSFYTANDDDSMAVMQTIIKVLNDNEEIRILGQIEESPQYKKMWRLMNFCTKIFS